MVLISLGVIHSLQSNGSLVPFVQRYWECRWVRILVWYNNQFRAHNLIQATLAAFSRRCYCCKVCNGLPIGRRAPGADGARRLASACSDLGTTRLVAGDWRALVRKVGTPEFARIRARNHPIEGA